MIPSVVLTPAVEHRRQLLISINCIHYKGYKAICQQFFDSFSNFFQRNFAGYFAGLLAYLLLHFSVLNPTKGQGFQASVSPP